MSSICNHAQLVKQNDRFLMSIENLMNLLFQKSFLHHDAFFPRRRNWILRLVVRVSLKKLLPLPGSQISQTAALWQTKIFSSNFGAHPKFRIQAVPEIQTPSPDTIPAQTSGLLVNNTSWKTHAKTLVSPRRLNKNSLHLLPANKGMAVVLVCFSCDMVWDIKIAINIQTCDCITS